LDDLSISGEFDKKNFIYFAAIVNAYGKLSANVCYTPSKWCLEQVCVQLRTSADNVALAAFAAARRAAAAAATDRRPAGRAAIDRYLLIAGPTVEHSNSGKKFRFDSILATESIFSIRFDSPI